MVVHFVVCVFGTIVKDDEFRGSMEAGGILCERPGKFIGRKNHRRFQIETGLRIEPGILFLIIWVLVFTIVYN